MGLVLEENECFDFDLIVTGGKPERVATSLVCHIKHHHEPITLAVEVSFKVRTDLNTFTKLLTRHGYYRHKMFNYSTLIVCCCDILWVLCLWAVTSLYSSCDFAQGPIVTLSLPSVDFGLMIPGEQMQMPLLLTNVTQLEASWMLKERQDHQDPQVLYSGLI